MAGLFTWGLTALGASLVFFFKRLSGRVTSLMLGMASGMMIAAGFWSLLAPAIELTEGRILPAAAGFAAGGAFLLIIERFAGRKGFLLTFSITLHNIPEGLAVGVALGGVAAGGGDLAGAAALALGIGIQNIPEGAAVAIPLRASGMSRAKSFFWGQLSGLAEPVAAIAGMLLVTLVGAILPYALSFAAGAMFFVVVAELIPEAHKNECANLCPVGALGGFLIMMILDLAF